jgi:hypothetical protein
MRTIIVSAATILCIIVCIPENIYAYLDIGTGSYLFQIAIGFLVGALFAVKMFWHRLKKWFRKIFSGKKEASDNKHRDV